MPDDQAGARGRNPPAPVPLDDARYAATAERLASIAQQLFGLGLEVRSLALLIGDPTTTGRLEHVLARLDDVSEAVIRAIDDRVADGRDADEPPTDDGGTAREQVGPWT